MRRSGHSVQLYPSAEIEVDDDLLEDADYDGHDLHDVHDGQDIFLPDGPEDHEDLEDDVGGSGGSSHSLHSAGSTHSFNSAGSSSGNLPAKGRRAAIMLSHKNMRRSSSAPSVSRDDGISKKRNRTTPEQLVILENAFAKKQSLDAQERELLAAQVDMTSKSVQIWFQNRRAKEKKAHREQNSPVGRAPMGVFTAQFQQLQPDFAIRHAQGGFSSASSGSSSQYGQSFVMPASALSSSVPVAAPTHMPYPANGHTPSKVLFPIQQLKIGTWTRITMQPKDLVCKISPVNQTMCWEIIEGQYRCKIEFNFASISLLELQIISDDLCVLRVTLTQLPMFYLETAMSDGTSAWKACHDITEDRQASTTSKHVVHGNTGLFNIHFLPLMVSDPYLASVVSFREPPPPLPSVAPMHSQPRVHMAEPRYPAAMIDADEKSMKKSYSVPAIPVTRPVSQFQPLDDGYPEYLAADVYGTATPPDFGDLTIDPEMLGGTPLTVLTPRVADGMNVFGLDGYGRQL